MKCSERKSYGIEEWKEISILKINFLENLSLIDTFVRWSEMFQIQIWAFIG